MTASLSDAHVDESDATDTCVTCALDAGQDSKYAAPLKFAHFSVAAKGLRALIGLDNDQVCWSICLCACDLLSNKLVSFYTYFVARNR